MGLSRRWYQLSLTALHHRLLLSSFVSPSPSFLRLTVSDWVGWAYQSGLGCVVVLNTTCSSFQSLPLMNRPYRLSILSFPPTVSATCVLVGGLWFWLWKIGADQLAADWDSLEIQFRTRWNWWIIGLISLKSLLYSMPMSCFSWSQVRQVSLWSTPSRQGGKREKTFFSYKVSSNFCWYNHLEAVEKTMSSITHRSCPSALHSTADKLNQGRAKIISSTPPTGQLFLSFSSLNSP